MQTLFIFLVVIIVLVVAHELGHFFVAKAFGVRVDEFGLGYPPRAKKLFTWKGTLFTLNWLPFGGFVKIFGEDDGGAKSDSVSTNSFSHQKLWKRLLILVAGIAANIVLAVVLYAMAFSIGFLGSASDFPNAKLVTPEQITVTQVLKGTPASDVGIKENDRIVSLTANSVEYVPEGVDPFIKYIQAHGDDKILVHISRENKDLQFIVTPKQNIVNGKPGIGIDETGLLRLPPLQAITFGASYTLNEFKVIVGSLCTLLVSVFSGNAGIASQLSGPVGIAKFADTAYSLGFGTLLSFMALISINLAVVNFLPFPALDGGRMILELFSTNGRNRISTKVVSSINQIGFLVLIVLMLWITYHDIFHAV